MEPKYFQKSINKKNGFWDRFWKGSGPPKEARARLNCEGMGPRRGLPLIVGPTPLCLQTQPAGPAQALLFEAFFCLAFYALSWPCLGLSRPRLGLPWPCFPRPL